jgi:hypothetical protein
MKKYRIKTKEEMDPSVITSRGLPRNWVPSMCEYYGAIIPPSYGYNPEYYSDDDHILLMGAWSFNKYDIIEIVSAKFKLGDIVITQLEGTVPQRAIVIGINGNHIAVNRQDNRGWTPYEDTIAEYNMHIPYEGAKCIIYTDTNLIPNTDNFKTKEEIARIQHIQKTVINRIPVCSGPMLDETIQNPEQSICIPKSKLLEPLTVKKRILI